MAARVYPLGNTQAEHERLARQAHTLGPVTERAFRSAGVAPGQRVLDLGSGAGDVAMLVAGIVGSWGEVIGVERNPESVEHARKRVEIAGLRNVTFIQADVGEIPADSLFDAAVGRFILMFVPDPVALVRSTARLVKPGGIIAFLEPTWKSTFTFSEDVPLWMASVAIVHETLLRSGADPEMGLNLYRVFQQAGLPAPAMHMETILGSPPETAGWVNDILHSVLPQSAALGISTEALGNLENLRERLESEIRAADKMVPVISVVTGHTSSLH